MKSNGGIGRSFRLALMGATALGLFPAAAFAQEDPPATQTDEATGVSDDATATRAAGARGAGDAAPRAGEGGPLAAPAAGAARPAGDPPPADPGGGAADLPRAGVRTQPPILNAGPRISRESPRRIRSHLG